MSLHTSRRLDQTAAKPRALTPPDRLRRTTITWYTGVDLLNPYCDRESKWTPTDDSMIIAVTQKWSARPACGEFMEIQTTDKGKKVSLGRTYCQAPASRSA